jgi:uncharacterized protein YndB with AHSA1/START domain
VQARARRELLAPPEDVWAFLREPHTFPDWWPGLAAVQPDRKGTATGARWKLVRNRQPTLFRKPGAGEGLVITAADPGRRLAFRLLDERLDVELSLEAYAHHRTLAELSVRGTVLWGPRRTLAREALGRLYDLCQTSAQS